MRRLSARTNPVHEFAKDYANVPGAIRIRQNPSGDTYLHLGGAKGLPNSVSRRLFGRRIARNPAQGEHEIDMGFGEKNVGAHGLKLSSDRIKTLLKRMIDINIKLIESGRPPVPICIWGSHGLGKTTLVRNIAGELGLAETAYIAPAQFEDPGDLLGLPTREEYTTKDGKKSFRTVYAQPEWVPEKADEARILLVDDFNRADSRLLRAMMQLFQDRQLAGWSLPSNCMIVATANPGEGGEYQVSELDPAMLTRMMHVEMVFDYESWRKWATSKDKHGKQNVDPRAVGWMQSISSTLLPEWMGKPEFPLTTPRTLDLLFSQLAYIDNWKKSIHDVAAYAYGTLDEDPAKHFIEYAMTVGASSDSGFPTETDIMTASSESAVSELIDRMKEAIQSGDEVSTGKLNKLGEGLIAYMASNASAVQASSNPRRARYNNSINPDRARRNLLYFLASDRTDVAAFRPVYDFVVQQTIAEGDEPETIKAANPFAQIITIDGGTNPQARALLFKFNADSPAFDPNTENNLRGTITAVPNTRRNRFGAYGRRR